MSFTRPPAQARIPLPATGTQVAAYPTYLQAQQAVDYLAEHSFPIEAVTIVGTDLQMVERVTGRLSYGRVALAGAGSGAWFGLFVGLLMSMFGGGGTGGAAAGGLFGGASVLVGIALGAGMGLLFSLLSYSMARGKRDFTSQSQIVAASYAILCEPSKSGEARSVLLRSPTGIGSGSEPVAGTRTTVPALRTVVARPPAEPMGGPLGAPAAPDPASVRKVDPRWQTPDGQPRYGAMMPGGGGGSGSGSGTPVVGRVQDVRGGAQSDGVQSDGVQDEAASGLAPAGSPETSQGEPSVVGPSATPSVLPPPAMPVPSAPEDPYAPPKPKDEA